MNGEQMSRDKQCVAGSFGKRRKNRADKNNRAAAAVCVMFGVLLWAYLSWFQPDPEPYLARGQVKREAYGGSTKEQKLIVSGLEKDEQTITVTVSPRVYTREEADAVF